MVYIHGMSRLNKDILYSYTMYHMTIKESTALMISKGNKCLISGHNREEGYTFSHSRKYSGLGFMKGVKFLSSH